MARNEEHTMKFLAKVLWKYRGAVKFREVMIRLLEFDCIRRNYSKGTLNNLLQQFRAWYRDPECKMAKKLPKSYIQYLEELKQADAEGLGCSIEEPTSKEDIEPDTDADNDIEKVDRLEELPLEEQYRLVEQAKENTKAMHKAYEEKIELEIEKLESKKDTAGYLAREKIAEYENVLYTLKRQIVWQEMMK